MDAHLLFYGDNMTSSAAGLFAGQKPRRRSRARVVIGNGAPTSSTRGPGRAHHPQGRRRVTFALALIDHAFDKARYALA